MTYLLREHPSIHFLPLNPSVGSRGGWSLSQQSSGDRRGSPWTGRQSITGPHRDKRDKQPCMHTFTPKDNLESLVNLTACFWTVGGSRSTRREPTYTRGEHANSTQKGPRWGSNLEPSHCEATVLTTTPPCHLSTIQWKLTLTCWLPSSVVSNQCSSLHYLWVS